MISHSYLHPSDSHPVPVLYWAPAEYSFAGTTPLRSEAAGGLLFERYTTKDDTIPPVQRYYFRPNKPSQPMPTRQGLAASAALAPPGTGPADSTSKAKTRLTSASRTLPNGIPVSRLRTHREQQAYSRSIGGADEGNGMFTDGANQQGQGSLLGPPVVIRSPGNSPARAAGDQRPEAATLMSVTSPRGVTHGSTGPVPGSPGSIGGVGGPDSAAALGALGAATTLAPGTAEPLLDDAFFALIQVCD
jgi:hypothetical protein